MKRICLLLGVVLLSLLAAPTASRAQVIKEKQPLDPKYLAGAVPVVDGIVTFTREIDLPEGADLDLKYEAAKHWVGRYFNRQDTEVLQRRTIDIDSAAHLVKVGINEFLVFKSNAIVLDRAQFVYSLAVSLRPGRATLTVSDIVYYYGEDSEFTDKSKVEKYDAETLITDAACLDKKGTRLNRQTGKFRIKTIDKVDDMAASLAEALK